MSPYFISSDVSKKVVIGRGWREQGSLVKGGSEREWRGSNQCDWEKQGGGLGEKSVLRGQGGGVRKSSGKGRIEV